MPQIQSFNFRKEEFDQIRDFRFGKNWPIIYILENGDEIYIGQTVSAFHRMKQHFEVPERKKLKKLHVISDDEFNLSATLDIESWLIQYISADGRFVLQNKNKGLQNHDYYQRQEKYEPKFEIIWEKLRQSNITPLINQPLVKHTLVDLKNSDLFKYSPYKTLSEEQLSIAENISKIISTNSEPHTFIIKGDPGTGKTILATYLFKFLSEQSSKKELAIGLVVPMKSLRKTIKKVFKKIKGLSASMVIGPSEVIRKQFDVLIVDEAHRLKRRKNITNYKSFDGVNKKLGLKDGTELDWIKKQSKNQILFYDENQSVKPSDVRKEDFKKFKSRNYILTSQQRIKVGADEYMHFIDNLFYKTNPEPVRTLKYDFQIYDDIKKLFADIKNKNNQLGLSRMVAGYAWPWHTARGTQDYDIEIDGYKAIWNSTAEDWINSKNSINEVGCIHTVQGYDLNYVGVIIGPEFGYDLKAQKFVINKEQYFDRNGRAGVHDPSELEFYIKNIYKTLLTRGIHGTYVYICDPGLREYFQNNLGNQQI